MGLLKRIVEQKSTISTRKLQTEHSEQQRVMKMRCEIARFDRAQRAEPEDDPSTRGLSDGELEYGLRYLIIFVFFHQHEDVRPSTVH